MIAFKSDTFPTTDCRTIPIKPWNKTTGLNLSSVTKTNDNLKVEVDCSAQLTYQKKRVKPWRQDWLIAAGTYPGFCSMKRLEVFLLPLDGMLNHRRSLPRNLLDSPKNLPVPWVERDTVRVKCLSQEHNTMSPARARTRNALSGVERTNQEATAPPTDLSVSDLSVSAKN